MFANLLPGLREIRAPVVSGYLWLIFLFLLLHSDLPSTSHPDSTFKPLVDLADDLSVIGVATVASVTAYLVGSAMQEVLKLIGRLPPRLRPMYASPGTHISQDGRIGIRRTVRIQVERITRRLLQVALSPGERGIDEAPNAEMVTRELPLVRTLLLGQHPELVEELDRLQAEADLRITVSVPLGLLAAYLAWHDSLGWALGLIPAVMLLVQGYQRQYEAGDFLAGVLQMGRVTAPAVKEFEVSVEAALERTDLERKLKGEMAEGDGMAAFRYANLLASSSEYKKAIEPLSIAVAEGVLQAYAELGIAWLELDDQEKAERAFRDGAERGDLKARERLADLLRQLQRTEEALEEETDEDQKEDEVEKQEADLPREQVRMADYQGRADQGDAKAAVNLGLLLSRREETEGAIDAFQLAADLDPEDPQALVLLGATEIKRSHFTSARAALEQALSIQERKLGPEHLEVGLTLGMLGTVMSELGQDEQALALKNRALEIFEQETGSGSSNVAITQTNIGRSLIDLGRYREALSILENALETERRILDEKDLRIATTLNNLGNARFFLGESRTAISINEQALALYEGSDSSPMQVAATLCNIGHARSALGEYQKALSLHRRALEAQEAVVGDSAVGITDSLDGIGAALNRLGDYAAALEALERSWGIKEAHRVSQLRVAQTLLLRAEALAGTGDLGASSHAAEKAREIFEEKLGESTPFVARSMVIEGENLSREGRSDRAERKLKLAIALGEASEDERDFDLPRALRALSRVEFDRGNLQGAEELVSRAIALTEKRHGPLFPDVATCLEVWADLREAKGEMQAAAVARRRAAGIRTRKTAPSDGDADD